MQPFSLVFLTKPEPPALLGTNELKDFHKAESAGIVVHFHGWPKEERPGVYERRPLVLSQKEQVYSSSVHISSMGLSIIDEIMSRIADDFDLPLIAA